MQSPCFSYPKPEFHRNSVLYLPLHQELHLPVPDCARPYYISFKSQVKSQSQARRPISWTTRHPDAMNTSIVAPVFLLSLTVIVLITAFACVRPTCTICRAICASLRRLRSWQGLSSQRSGYSGQDIAGGGQQQQGVERGLGGLSVA